MRFAGFHDELEKIGRSNEKIDVPSLLKSVAGGLGAAGIATAGLVLSRKPLRAHFLNEFKTLRTGGHAAERSKSLPAAVIADAKKVSRFLLSKGIDPRKARIAISGTGGTGKTSLARGIAGELSMKPLMMDDVGKTISGRDLTKYVRKNPIKRGVVAEQTHLLNQVDPDKFDAIIRVHKPMAKVEQQILARGRGAGQLDFYDYRKLHKSIQTAFHSTAGKSHDILPHVQIKIKPKTGFNADKILTNAARKRGVDVAGESRRSVQVFAAAHGSKPITPGLLPYLKTRNIAVGAGAVAASGIGAGLAGYHHLGGGHSHHKNSA
jgi:hypothetical protein